MKKYIAAILVFCVGCTSSVKNKVVVKVSLINQNRDLQISGPDKLVLAEIGRDSSSVVWQSLAPVYKMPADTELKNLQPVQPGRYVVKDSVLVFTPDTPFIKGTVYFVRAYQYDQEGRLTDLVKGNLRAGQIPFTDLIFKQ